MRNESLKNENEKWHFLVCWILAVVELWRLGKLVHTPQSVYHMQKRVRYTSLKMCHFKKELTWNLNQIMKMLGTHPPTIPSHIHVGFYGNHVVGLTCMWEGCGRWVFMCISDQINLHFPRYTFSFHFHCHLHPVQSREENSWQVWARKNFQWSWDTATWDSVRTKSMDPTIMCGR